MNPELSCFSNELHGIHGHPKRDTEGADRKQKVSRFTAATLECGDGPKRREQRQKD